MLKDLSCGKWPKAGLLIIMLDSIILPCIILRMKFVDREQEQIRLERLVNKRSNGALAVIWGRRRVGKTRLLVEWVRKHAGIYWVADESAGPLHRRSFAETLATKFAGFSDVEYRDWESLLHRLAAGAKREQFKGPLVIDELPYVISASPEFSSILQRFVDHEAKDAKLTLAVAGSSQRMMQGLVLDASAPLYGRASEIMKIVPIPAPYLGEALSIKDARRIIEMYAVLGGIPRYWELAENFADLDEMIDALLLDPLGPLHEEPARLLQSEVPSAAALRPVLEAIGLGNHRISEIASRLGVPATSVARPIQQLQELDLVEREIPFGESEQGGKRALYKLADPMMAFWFGVMLPKRSQLVQAKSKMRLQLIRGQLPEVFAAAWEKLCRLSVPGLEIGGVEWGPARRYWHGQGSEWNVVAQSIDGSTMLLGEVKWTTNKSHRFMVQTAALLKQKGIPPVRRPANARIVHAIFVPEYAGRSKLEDETFVVDAKDVLRALR
jgi:uncharacterized protein